MFVKYDLLLSFPELNVTTKPSSPVNEGSDVTVTCTHDLPNGSISWLMDNELQKGENNEEFQIKIILKDKNITCNVDSDCGNINSTITITVKGDYTAHHFCVCYIINNINNSNKF